MSENPQDAASTVAYCRVCGTGLTEETRRFGNGIVYCPDHLPPGSSEQAPLQRIRADGSPSPVLAFVLGLIPGVGAIYNGQYAKGFVHAIVFGLLINLMSEGHGSTTALFGIVMTAFVPYMAFEAYHTAQKRSRGEPVDEFSSLVSFRGSAAAGPVLLIVIGVIFLMDTLEVMHLRQVLRFWPVILIVIGVAMLYGRLTSASDAASAGEEIRNER